MAADARRDDAQDEPDLAGGGAAAQIDALDELAGRQQPAQPLGGLGDRDLVLLGDPGRK